MLYLIVILNVSLERYLCSDITIHLRIALSRFRCSNFNIAVECGRYTGVEYYERLCPFCKERGQRYVENEYHILFICNAYDKLRTKYIAKYTKEPYSHYSVVNILLNKNDEVIYQVGLYLYHVQEIINSRM